MNHTDTDQPDIKIDDDQPDTKTIISHLIPRPFRWRPTLSLTHDEKVRSNKMAEETIRNMRR